MVVDPNVGAVATVPVIPPTAVPPAPLINPVVPVGTAAAFAIPVVPPLVGLTTTAVVTPTGIETDLIAANQPTIPVQVIKPAPIPGAGEQDDTPVPNADPGGLVTDFRVTNESSTAADQISGLAGDGFAPEAWSLLWKLSPALVLLLATALEMWRRRLRAAEVSGERANPEWFLGLAELPNKGEAACLRRLTAHELSAHGKYESSARGFGRRAAGRLSHGARPSAGRSVGGWAGARLAPGRTYPS